MKSDSVCCTTKTCFSDRPKKVGLRPPPDHKVQDLPLLAVRTPCRPLPIRFNRKNPLTANKPSSKPRSFLPITTQKAPLCPWALVLELLVVQEVLSDSLRPQLPLFLIRYSLIKFNSLLSNSFFPSLDPQSRQYLPQQHFLAAEGTPWTETQTLPSPRPWVTTTSLSRVNKESGVGEGSPAMGLWAQLRAWSVWPAPQDPSHLHP